jgi:hypothetical protein
MIRKVQVYCDYIDFRETLTHATTTHKIMESALVKMPVYFAIHAGRKRFGLYTGDNSQINEPPYYKPKDLTIPWLIFDKYLSVG